MSVHILVPSTVIRVRAIAKETAWESRQKDYGNRTDGTWWWSSDWMRQAALQLPLPLPQLTSTSTSTALWISHKMSNRNIILERNRASRREREWEGESEQAIAEPAPKIFMQTAMRVSEIDSLAGWLADQAGGRVYSALSPLSFLQSSVFCLLLLP